MRTFTLFILLGLGWWPAWSQRCTVIGQNPGTAFPVCGTSKFVQASVPICGMDGIPVHGCSTGNASYFDKNPFWYKFTCFESGTLVFTITPKNLGDDYDWQLFDITGHAPSDVYTNASLFVVGNWSGSYGLTGASLGASANIQCASNPVTEHVPTFSKSPKLVKGHNYLLLVSHFTDSQSGYTLSFGGGTAVITDTLQPHLKSLTARCDGVHLTLLLNKRMKCSSVAANGSDFVLLPSGTAKVIAATGVGCSNGFDVDTVIITLDQRLNPGNYQLMIQTGSDMNTMLDNCDNAIPSGEQIPFTVYPAVPTPMDSLNPVGCAPDELVLSFRNNIYCSSIAEDGSDFRITGSTNVSIIGATGACVDGLSPYVKIKLSAPIQAAGNYQIELVKGSDGNTLVNECNLETPAGETISFHTVDTVSAAIGYETSLGCHADTIRLSNNGGASITQWTWTFDSLPVSHLQNPSVVYAQFGIKHIQLEVTNGVCTSTSAVDVDLDNTLLADFEVPEMVCPAENAHFVDKSIGRSLTYFWDLGDGSTDRNETPSDHFYTVTPVADKLYTVTLVVKDDLGCTDTTSRVIRKLHTCYIAVPNAFTPNGDGVNDYLYPLNGFKASDLEFRVYNRYGQLVFESRDWNRRWDGTLNGKPQDAGTFVWTLRYTDSDSGKRYDLKGTTVLIR